MIGYLDLILLFRSTICMKGVLGLSNASAVVSVTIIVLAAACIGMAYFVQNVTTLFAFGSAVAMFCFLGSLLFISLKVNNSDFCLLSIAVFVAFSGLCVNPVQQGAYALTEGDTAMAISEVNSECDNWIAGNSALGDLCIAQGASCINSVNTYPSLSMWRKIDPSGIYVDVYNRYAHITVQPTEEASSFELVAPDAFTVHLSLEDALKLGVTKWITSDDLSMYDTEKVKATLVSNAGSNKIWQLEDSDG